MQIHEAELEVPIILISSCKDPSHGGDYKYNGGVKLYNLWVKLLRANGYPAFIVTHDGTYQQWLVEHQPHVSLETVQQWKQAGFPLKFVSGWADSTAFVDLADELYFYDCEIAYTSTVHFPVLSRLLESPISAVATNSRVQHAWYMATFKRDVAFIPEWSDETYWHPNPGQRKSGLIGYMKESSTAEIEIEQIAACCKRADVQVDFIEVKGDEGDVLAMLQRCDLYIGLNPGKHPLWGEGCPRTQQEAMHAGCVVVAYDVRGNREYLIHGYSGFVAPRGRADVLADYLVELMRDTDLKERIRSTSLDLASRAFTVRGRWPLLRDFLGLEDFREVDSANRGHAMPTRPELEQFLAAPAYIGEEEIPVFAKYVSSAKGSLVEIGAAYGASTILMLTHAPAMAMVYSIDPFWRDSHGGFQVSAGECRRNVSRALKSLAGLNVLSRWCLYIQPSCEVVQRWDQPVGFLYIDGDHKYQAVKKDFQDWVKHVMHGGIIVLHDSRREPNSPEGVFARGWPGPTQLANELTSHRCVELIEEVFSMTIWRRTDLPCQDCRV